MSRFNFDNYNKEEKRQELKVGAFKPIEIGGTRGGNSATKPLVSISKSTIRFNCFFSTGEYMCVTKHNQFKAVYSYVQFMVEGNLLAVRFLKDKAPNSIKISLGKDKALSGAFTSIYKHLKDHCDSVNLDAFNYQFLVENDSEDIFYFDLSKPWSKKKIKKRNE